MNPRFAGLIGGLLLLSTMSLEAQEPITAQLYGTGVHSYFSGDYRKAHELLSSAIASGSKDPRTYYFRGLCYLRLGRDVEAKQDFDEGARLETAELDRGFNISRSFERVQGTDRAVLEQYRVKLRLAAFQREERLRQERYEKLRQDEKRVLEQHAAPTSPAPGAASAPLANPMDAVNKAKPGAADQASGEKESSADPLSDSGADKKKETAAAAAAAKKDAKVDDAMADSGDEKKPAAKKAAKSDDDPFADSGDEKKPAAKKPAAKDDDDPFANPGGMSDKKAAGKKTDEADPFAEGSDDKKAAGKKPAAKAAKSDDDPFASDAGDEKPAKKAGAPAKKATAPKKGAKKGADADADGAGDEPAPKKGAKKAAR